MKSQDLRCNSSDDEGTGSHLTIAVSSAALFLSSLVISLILSLHPALSGPFDGMPALFWNASPEKYSELTKIGSIEAFARSFPSAGQEAAKVLRSAAEDGRDPLARARARWFLSENLRYPGSGTIGSKLSGFSGFLEGWTFSDGKKVPQALSGKLSLPAGSGTGDRNEVNIVSSFEVYDPGTYTICLGFCGTLTLTVGGTSVEVEGKAPFAFDGTLIPVELKSGTHSVAISIDPRNRSSQITVRVEKGRLSDPLQKWSPTASLKAGPLAPEHLCLLSDLGKWPAGAGRFDDAAAESLMAQGMSESLPDRLPILLRFTDSQARLELLNKICGATGSEAITFPGTSAEAKIPFMAALLLKAADLIVLSRPEEALPLCNLPEINEIPESILAASRALLRLRRYDEALAKASRALELLPDSHEALLNLAASFKALELDGPWLETMKKYCSAKGSDKMAAELVAGHLLDAGRTAEAFEIIESASRACPDDSALTTLMATGFAALGELDKALKTLSGIRPESADSLADAAGLILSGGGDIARARELLKRAVEISPGNFRATGLLSLLGDDGNPFVSLILGTSTEGIPEIGSGPKGSRVLNHRAVTVFKMGGLTERYVRKVILVGSEAAAAGAIEEPVVHAPTRQEVTLLRASTGPMGEKSRLNGGISLVPVSVSAGSIHHDSSAAVLSVPGVREGEIVDLAWIVRDLVSPPAMTEGYGDFFFPRGKVWVDRFSYAFFNQTNMKLSTAIISDGASGNSSFVPISAAGITGQEWSGGPLTAVGDDEEESSSMVPFAQVTSFASWTDVAEVFRKLSKGRAVPSGSIRDLAGKLASGAGTRIEVIARIQEFLTTSIRYVAVESGLRAIQPAHAPEVLTRKFGDCKDKTFLGISLLGVAGITAEPALVRTRGMGTWDSLLPSLSVFDHAMIWIPSEQMWLDPTVPFLEPGSTIPETGNSLALVSGNSPVLTRTAISADDRRELWRLSRRDEEITIEVTESLSGLSACSMRAALTDTTGKVEFLSRRWKNAFPDARLVNLTTTDPRCLSEPLALRYTVKLGIQNSAKLQTVYPLGLDLVKRFCPGERTRYPVSVRGSFERSLETRRVASSEPPSGPGIDLTSKWGSLSVESKCENGLTVTKVSLTLSDSIVTPAEYPVFREFCLAVDAASGDPIE